ncbi:phosphatidylserine/phosphatidylglycerophosphate/cardiolipin synthase family protein [Corynebacterium sp. Marseille-P4321]|uniref:phospholipase D-like domain-containing protein n=1 Tax=Corynebacterium sp. Marseille-P4321 TaxID=2736603 RepID=UPI0015890916|nr:phospholipase D-like domain-containing protein [Corynebacterium sp. Marseille-P4321]
MTDLSTWQLIGLIVDYTIKFIMIGIVPGNRKPSSANAWLLLILLLPVVGLPLYLLMGSTVVSRRRHRIQQEANREVENVHHAVEDYPSDSELGEEVASLVHLNRELTGFPAVYGRVPYMWTDYHKTMRRIAELIDASVSHVHIEIYAVAWDETTHVVFQAIERAVARGVHVRLLFDHIGSQKYPGFRRLKRRLTDIGVDWHLMLPLDPLHGRWRRPDLRNHRKLVIIDSEVAFLGSFNLIDRGYLMPGHVRAGREWVDTFVELSGPIVTSVESMFSVDWYTESGEVIKLHAPQKVVPGVVTAGAGGAGIAGAAPGAAAGAAPSDVNLLQLVPSGPGYTTEPNLRMFNAMVHHAKESLVLCSPYFVPEDSLLEAITSACYRGVRVDLLVGEKADQFMVQHAQSSYYEQLLRAGVHIWEFPAPFVLHSKFALADAGTPGAVGVVGSSNMDIRSFSLNYESSLFVAGGSLLPALEDLSEYYLAVSHQLTLTEWEKRPWYRRYVDNVMKLTSALQ